MQLAAGILIHKTCASISIGAGFAKTDMSLTRISVFIFCFSLSTPIGIVIGLKLVSLSSLLQVIFFQLSAGTFIYVAASEIITHEFEDKRWNGIKLLFTLVGGIVIGSLWFLNAET